MQLSAAQTSLEPQPRRGTKPSRRPFVSQNINQDDGSRFASEPDLVQRPRIAAHGLPSQSQTSCRFCVSDRRTTPLIHRPQSFLAEAAMHWPSKLFRVDQMPGHVG
jgi:hypothetical protein